MLLRQDGATIHYIQPYVEADGSLLNMIQDPVTDGIVRVRRDNLVNLTDTDYSNSGANRWKVFYSSGS